MTRPKTIALFVAACGGIAGCDDDPPPLVVAPRTIETPLPSTRSPTIMPGHLAGVALVSAEQYLADGLLAPDGELRLNMYTEADGAVGRAAQVVAHMAITGDRATGDGTVIGQRCSAPLPSPFCGVASPLTITLTALEGPSPRSTGEISVSTAAGTEVWWLTIGYWGGIPQQGPSWPSSLSGLYHETIAEFAGADTVIISLNGGRLFFQSSDTGCIGNGSLSSAFDSVGILRAELTIAGCIGERSPLNAHFVGLATFEAVTPWEYSYGPKLWLSTSSGDPVALTTFADKY